MGTQNTTRQTKRCKKLISGGVESRIKADVKMSRMVMHWYDNCFLTFSIFRGYNLTETPVPYSKYGTSFSFRGRSKGFMGVPVSRSIQELPYAWMTQYQT